MLRPIGRVHLPYWISLFFLLWVAVTAAAADLPIPPEALQAESQPQQLTLGLFQKILRTEVGSHQGNRHRRLMSPSSSQQQLEEFWNATLEDEWQRAREREEQHQKKHRGLRPTDEQDGGSSAFVLCDVGEDKNGQESVATVRELMGDKMTTLFNKADMTCFAVEAPASTVLSVASSNTGILAAPMSPEMKMGENLLHHIATSEPMVSRVEAVFCAGQATQDAERLAAHVYEAMLSSTTQEGDGERNNIFDDRQSTPPDGDEDDPCQAMMAAMTLDAAVDTMVLSLADEHLNDDDGTRDCLHAVAYRLARHPQVCFVWASRPVELLNTVAAGVVQSGDGGETPFYDAGIRGNGQVVAVSDTGLDTDNCYFWDATASVSKNEQSNSFDRDVRKVIQYYAFADDEALPSSHGTHVAGTIAGRRANGGRTESTGTADGIAFKAQLAFFDIGFPSGRLSTPLPATLFAPGFNAGARIHSVSWGTPMQNFYSGYDRSVDVFMYNHPDFLFIAAAGNDGAGNLGSSINSPSVNKNGICVGAAQNASPHIRSFQLGPDYLAEFSSRGPTRDGRRKPDIVAPGTRIFSAKANPNQTGECDSSGTMYKSGTSMAAPVVAGTAALVREYFMDGRHVNGKENRQSAITPRSSLLKAVLLNSGQSLVAVQNIQSGAVTETLEPYDIHQGFGRIDLIQSLPLDGENSISGIFVNGKVIQNDEEDTYQVRIRNAAQCGPLSATLVWTDPAGAPNCNECLLNDLDLSLSLRGRNRRFFPNGLNRADTVNNAERVQINSPNNGDIYTVHVKGTNLVEDQEYSLVVTGCFTETIDGGDDDPDNDNGVSGGGQGDSDCANGSGTFNIGTGTYRTCVWLTQNMDDYAHLCSFRDVALKCRSTCGTCRLGEEDAGEGERKRALTAWDGESRWYGNHIDLYAKIDLTIRRFDIHLNRVGSYQIKVMVRSGQLNSSNNNWSTVCSGTVESEGFGEITSIPASACTPLPLESGQWRTFYITTLAENDLVMKRGVANGTNLINNSEIRVRSGTAVTYENAASYNRYAFNGAIHYTFTLGNSVCQDATGLVFVDDTVGERTCSWLASNRDRYEFACEFIVSVHCPVTCNVCGEI